MNTSQRGFTLVEIAVVLVIIGLLLGGAMKGQEMINSAKVKNLANDFRNIPLFIYAYQDKFRALPGDDPAPDTHVKGTKTTTGTPGNGVINGSWNTTTQTDESYLFWQHVRLAGLSSGTTTPSAADYLPQNAVGGKIGVTGSANLPIKSQTATYVICSANIQGKLAKQLDILMDDSNTAAGAMQVMENQDDDQTTAATAVTTTTIDDNKAYTVCYAT